MKILCAIGAVIVLSLTVCAFIGSIAGVGAVGCMVYPTWTPCLETGFIGYLLSGYVILIFAILIAICAAGLYLGWNWLYNECQEFWTSAE